MSYRTSTIALGLVVGTGIAAAAFAQSAPEPDNGDPLTRSRQLPQYTDFRRPEAANELASMDFCRIAIDPRRANGGHANFPEYHNVYIEPGSYDDPQEKGVFPDGTIFVKELQLTVKPEENRMAHGQIFGTGLFPWRFNGADVTVRTQTLCRSEGGILQFQSSRAKGSNRQGKVKSKWAFCHIASAKRDEVWTQFYRVLDEVPAPQGVAKREINPIITTFDLISPGQVSDDRSTGLLNELGAPLIEEHVKIIIVVVGVSLVGLGGGLWAVGSTSVTNGRERGVVTRTEFTVPALSHRLSVSG